MKRWLIGTAVGVALLVIAVVACAPKAAPAPPVAPTPTPEVAAPQPSRALTPEEAAWDKVVAAARKEGKVAAYSFHFAGGVGIGLAEAFKKKYGIQLEITSGPGMQLIERLKAEKRAGEVIGDILTTATPVVLIAKGDGLTVPVGDLPSLNKQGVWFGGPKLDDEGHLLGMGVSFFGALINTKLVKSGQEPEAWKDLLEPRWKGNVVFGDPNTIPNSIKVYVALTSRKKLDREYFAQLGRQELKIVSTIPEFNGAVARGEGALAFAADDWTSANLVRQGAPLKLVKMAEGTPVDPGGSALSMLGGAPHPNSSRLFLDWFMSKEGQTAYVNLIGARSIRKDVPDRRPVPLQITAEDPVVMTLKDAAEVTRVMRDKELSKLMFGK